MTSKMIERLSGGRVRDAGQPDAPSRSGGDLLDAGRVGDVVDAADVGAARVDVHQAGDARRRGHEHGELAQGVPGTGVDQDDVDDVAAAAELERLLGQRRGDGVGGARRARDEEEAGGHDRHGHAERDPQVALAAQRAVGEVLGEPAQGQHEDHHGQRLDQRLGEREVGRALEDEEERRAVAGDADEQDRADAGAASAPSSRPRRR